MNNLSLLWPDFASASGKAVQELYADSVRDLRVESLAQLIASQSRHRQVIASVLKTVVDDERIIHYRQAILTDLLAQPALVAALAEVLPRLDSMTAQPFTFRKRHALYDVVERLGELELYVTTVESLRSAFDAAPETPSAGLSKLRKLIMSIAEDDHFATLIRELPALQQQVRQVASVTIGVNLDHNLKPVAATLLTVNGEPFTESSMLSRIFGRKSSSSTQGKLHRSQQFDQATMAELKAALGGRSPQILQPLFADLADVLEKVSQPVARALKAYGDVTTATLVNLRDELAFYVEAVGLFLRLQRLGLPVCIPTVQAQADKWVSAESVYNLELALQHVDHNGLLTEKVVSNDVHLGQPERLVILTGPNGGGKTTWLHAIGTLQLMAQAGLPVPAASAQLKPVDNIFTHYQGEEDPSAGTGRFGEEAVRFKKLFSHATPNSLLLLNESLASTSAGESLYLAQDIVLLFGRIGLRAIFATHLHELAARVATLNAQMPTPCVISMVASRTDEHNPSARSFRVAPGPPLGHSYAKELAARYGIAADQLTSLLRERGIFDADSMQG